jgi:hypothetical protein
VEEPQYHNHMFVLSPRCEEYGQRWDDPAERWRIYFTSEAPPAPATHCPGCARRDFGD